MSLIATTDVGDTLILAEPPSLSGVALGGTISSLRSFPLFEVLHTSMADAQIFQEIRVDKEMFVYLLGDLVIGVSEWSSVIYMGKELIDAPTKTVLQAIGGEWSVEIDDNEDGRIRTYSSGLVAVSEIGVLVSSVSINL